MDFDRTSFTDGINALVCFPLDVDPLHIRVEESGEIGLNGILVRADLGALADHCAVEISDSKPSGSDSVDRFGEKGGRIRALPAWICIGKQLTDIWLPDRAEQRISHRMKQRVPIRVTDRASIMLDDDTAQDERPSGALRAGWFQSVEVIPMSDFRLDIVHMTHSTLRDAAFANGGRPSVPIDWKWSSLILSRHA